MFGILDAGISLAKEMFADERQEDAQAFSSSEAAAQRQFNSAEALANRNWQEYMSSTAVTRHAADLKAAGFNPLLAVHPGGGASTPAGGAASSGIASAGIASPGSNANIAASMASAAQVDVNEALAGKIRAEEAEIRARTPRHEWDIEEIKARIPRHAADVDKARQEIAESAVRIEKLWEDTKVSTATAANVQQQTRNLQETVAQIRSQVGHLNALAAKESAATHEIKQRVRQDLPQLEKILMDLERVQRLMAQPGQQAQEAAQGSLIGQIGAYLRALNPLQGFLGIVPTRSRSTTINHNTTIRK